LVPHYIVHTAYRAYCTGDAGNAPRLSGVVIV
jgi:hypothetical protein